jgi:hypothetical protein
MLTQISSFYLIIAGLAGLLIGLLVAGLLGNRDSKARKASEPTPEMKKEGFSEVARLWYSPATKKILTEIDDEFFKSNSDLSHEQQKKVLRLSCLLTEWTKAEPVTENPVTPVPFAAAQPTETAQTVPVLASPEVESAQPSPFVDTTSIINDQSIPTINQERPLKTEADAFTEDIPVAKENPEPAKIKPKTIAGQISDIIEEMIQTSPLREKGIRLIEREDHGVDVWYGMEKFDGVEAIPYPEVKQLIKAAAARWEREAAQRNKPGVNS